MSRRFIVSASMAVAASAAIASFAVKSAPPAAASGNYSDWGAPVNLGSAINTTASEQHPAISKDGLTLYFSSDRPGGQGGLDLWVAHRESEEASWGTPVNLSAPINSAGAEFAPAFSPDGHKLYYHSDRPGGFGLLDLYVCTRTHTDDDQDWGPPVNLGGDVNSIYNDAGPTLFVDEDGTTTMWFTVLNKPGGLGDWDIYRSVMGADGAFGAPENVVELNSAYRDTRTTIRHDGREMILTSERPGGVNTGPGRADLWVSTRDTPADAWATPVNLGDTVNGPTFDGAPALSWDGKTLFFYSNRTGGAGGNDLWMTTRRHPGNQ